MADSIEEISPEDVDKLIKQEKAESIIDVREHNEVAGGRIPGARHIPLGEIL